MNTKPELNSYHLPSKPKKKTPLPPLFSAAHIRELDDAHSSVKYVTWDDNTIDYAYAYEGIVIPGGKIMMGRWWRVDGINGMGAARETGPDGIGVEMRAVQTEQEEEVRKVEKAKRPTRRRRGNWRNECDSEGDDEAEDSDGLTDDEGTVKDCEYEFVNLVHGEESRALNGAKGLERGPFVFWTI